MTHVVRLVLFCSFLFTTSYAIAQKSILDKSVTLTEKTTTVLNHLTALEANSSVNFTYSSNYINLQKVISIKLPTQSIKEHLRDILKGQNIKYEVTSTNRILLSKGNKKYRLRGVIYDEFSKEGLLGVQIRNVTDNRHVTSDSEGYFTIACNDTIVVLEFDYFGFDNLVQETKVIKGIQSFYLSSGTLIPQVLITEDNIGNTVTGSPGRDILKPINFGSFSNFLGDNSISEEIKNLPYVQSGNEGESGYHIRGGGIDQNLILYEGVPMYESNHTAGLSSIFIADAIKDIAVYAENLPARYGGRLSSVIDVKLKSGKTDSIRGSSAIGLTGANFYLSGPLSKNKKLLFNVSGRLSLVQYYISPFLKRAFGYENSDFGYHDLNAKMTYQFAPSHSLSVIAYSGRDQVRLNRSITTEVPNVNQSFVNTERNQVGWGNNLVALNYTNLLSDKLVLKSHFSTLDYNYSSRGSYSFVEKVEDVEVNNNEIDILSYSSIRDFNGFVDLSYYQSENIFYKVGVGRQIHLYNPTIRQNTVIREQDINEVVDGDSSIIVSDQYLFFEANISPANWLDINTGVRMSGYEVRGKNYSYTEPRFELSMIPYKGHKMGFSYAQMVQYIHLLVNPGNGIPSDLWVPSTENIAPEFGEQFSFSYSFLSKDNIKLRLGLYYKTMENLLDYDNPFDLLYSVINEGEFVPVFTTSNEWERRVTAGRGHSKGIELNMEKAFPNGKLNLTYAFSRTTRTFASIDNGEAFPFKYDRRHDINASAIYNIGEQWNLAAKWIYGTGNTFTLANEIILTPEGEIIKIPSSRNNFRHKPFHHLDLNLNYIFLYKRLACRLSVGVYNAYNRWNPYYVYLYEDPLQESFLRTSQVSLFPLIPHIGFKASW